MANNGYLISGVCSPSVYSASLAVCPPLTVRIFHGGTSIVDCYKPNSANTGWTYISGVPLPLPNCEITSSTTSSIPTVADGITLGWQAGAALILVGCILFLKKALK